MKTARSVGELKRLIAGRCPEGKIGFVPTMGALHKGHISLIEQSKRENAVTVASIFVNPTQFNDPNDLRNYPRSEEKDCRMLEEAGCDIVFIPTVEEIYPEPDTRQFDFGDLDKVMEGAHRKGHFNGVAQVVSKLFEMVEPDNAYFGEKDFQQLAIVRSLRDVLGLKTNIVGAPIVREEDGLAMSSRNMLLSPGQRAAAPGIYRAMQKYAGRRDITPSQAVELVIKEIDPYPALKTEYFIIADENSLKPVTNWNEGTPRGFAAVRAGNIRLIDNIKY